MADTIVEFNTLDVGPDEVATYAVLFTTEAGQVTPASSYTASLQSGSAQYQITVAEACVGIYRIEAYNGDGLTLAQGWVWIEADDTATYIADGSYNAVKQRFEAAANNTASAATLATILTDTGTDLPAGQSTLAANQATLSATLAAILEDTGTTLPDSIATLQSGSNGQDSSLAALTTSVASILEDTGTTLPATLASILEDTGTTLPATLANILTDTGTDIPAQITGLNNVSVAEIFAGGDVDGYTLEQTLKLLAAVMLGKVSGGGTNTNVFRAADDSKNRVTGTVDKAGNRSSVTLDAS